MLTSARHNISGHSTDSVPPKTPVPQNACRLTDAGLFKKILFPSNYIANCRLCLGAEFGDRCTTIINEELATMMKQVFPIVIVNQIGLPMNVCTGCVKKVEVFYIFSTLVLANQQKLAKTSTLLHQLEGTNKLVESKENSDTNRSIPQNTEQEIPIDAELLIKKEPDTQEDARLFKKILFPSNYISNCRLCLGTEFGDRWTTIINEEFVTMMKHIFPIMISNKIGLPMNVCTGCVMTVEAFYTFSTLVLANQQKLAKTSTLLQQLDGTNQLVEAKDNPDTNRITQEVLEQEAPIDTAITPVQGALLNEMPFPSSYIANCRLCLGTKFGDRSTTIVNEQLVAMMRQVFPIVIVNQIGLPMNVCTECVKKIEAFYTFSSQVLTNQKKLQEPSTKQVDKQAPEGSFNGSSFPSSYIANCRLCLGTEFGDRSSSVNDAQLIIMINQLISIEIVNQVGLPMNVCTECVKKVEAFYNFSSMVLANQKKLLGTLPAGSFIIQQ
uniref:ZAD domain-containing protein n=1 Tax=Anopheles epiroticus TaxID=199890 RepID=A0A182PIK2_9DIPT